MLQIINKSDPEEQINNLANLCNLKRIEMCSPADGRKRAL
jgi:hypothetical protein